MRSATRDQKEASTQVRKDICRNSQDLTALPRCLFGSSLRKRTLLGLLASEAGGGRGGCFSLFTMSAG